MGSADVDLMLSRSIFLNSSYWWIKETVLPIKVGNSSPNNSLKIEVGAVIRLAVTLSNNDLSPVTVTFNIGERRYSDMLWQRFFALCLWWMVLMIWSNFCCVHILYISDSRKFLSIFYPAHGNRIHYQLKILYILSLIHYSMRRNLKRIFFFLEFSRTAIAKKLRTPSIRRTEEAVPFNPFWINRPEDDPEVPSDMMPRMRIPCVILLPVVHAKVSIGSRPRASLTGTRTKRWSK